MILKLKISNKEEAGRVSNGAKKCIAGGAKPVFVVGKKVYTINNPEKVTDFIGDKVTISSTITGDALEIEKVSK